MKRNSASVCRCGSCQVCSDFNSDKFFCINETDNFNADKTKACLCPSCQYWEESGAEETFFCKIKEDSNAKYL